MRKSIVRKPCFVLAVLVGLAVSTPAHQADADLFGGDIPILAGILAQSIQTVTNLVQQLNALKMQITMMKTMLSRLDVSSFSDVMRTIRSTEFAYNTLVGDVRSIEYTINGVNRQFQKIFPSDASTAKPADMRTTAAGWHNETLGAALVAQRSQSTLSTISNNTDQATAVLSRSAGAEGEIAQLQAVNQMLGIISSQLNSMISVLDTTGRVTADMAGTSASGQVVSIEKKRRNVDNYTDRGPQGPVMTKLPDPH
jgi:conjugal transfer/entry exclusion protein